MPKQTLLLIFLLAIALFSAFFAFQNNDPVSIQIGKWQFENSEAVFLLIAMGIGLILSGIASLPSIIGRSFEIRTLKSKIKKLEKELQSTKTEKAEVTAENQKKTKKIKKIEAEQALEEAGIETVSADE